MKPEVVVLDVALEASVELLVEPPDDEDSSPTAPEMFTTVPFEGARNLVWAKVSRASSTPTRADRIWAWAEATAPSRAGC